MAHDPLDIDTADIRRWYTAQESSARATGKWGQNNLCVPADADAWKSACENDFPVGFQQFRWGAYQKSKVGTKECSVNSERRPRFHPVADGVNPHGTNSAEFGCLILEAKSSAAENEQDSLYGIREEEDDLDLLRNRRRLKPKHPIWGAARDLGAETGEEFREDQNIRGLLDILTTGEDALDPRHFEDAVDEAWADDRGQSTSLWGVIRTTQISALIFYEMACSDPEIPFQDYVVIVERRYMRRYFESIITPSGKVIESAWSDGRTWEA